LLQRVEAREPITLDLVAEVVGQPRKAIEGEKIAAQLRGKPAQRHREVLEASLRRYGVGGEQPRRIRAVRRAG
jgi:hypothetical protein